MRRDVYLADSESEETKPS